MILGLFRKDTRRTLIATLYERVATASRVPGSIAALGVPDTVEGRFEALSLHVVLVLRALREPAHRRPTRSPRISWTPSFATSTPRCANRASATRVPKRMKTLAEAFYGRARAYDAPLDAGDGGRARGARSAATSRARGTRGRLARYAARGRSRPCGPRISTPC